jgi:predicted metalloprotease with PDZ domain
MSEDFTKAVVVKRSAKQKSGYTVTETDGDYYVTGIPAKARVNKGDKIVGINGIYSGEFLDADDANDLMESIRIVVVPQGKIKEYEAAKEAEEAGGEGEEEESSEEDYEENERPTSTRKKQDKRIGTVFVGRPDEVRM